MTHLSCRLSHMVLPYNKYFQLKKIAWNGIRIRIPASWQPAVIDPYHLLFEAENGPTLELSWRRTPQRDKAVKTIYRQLRQTAKSHRCKLRETSLPKAWRRALKSYDINGFFWKNHQHSAHGAVISCPQCQMVTLLQFFNRSDTYNQRLSAQILATFQDHVEQDAMTCWAMYDICAQLSPELRLTRYKFDAGAFQLNFKHKNTTVTLYRFAPASVILSDLSLDDFSTTRWPAASKIQARESLQAACVEYRTFAQDKKYRQLLDRCMGREKKAWVRVSCLHHYNRIHAVRIESDHQNPQLILAAAAENFLHVQEKK